MSDVLEHTAADDIASCWHNGPRTSTTSQRASPNAACRQWSSRAEWAGARAAANERLVSSAEGPPLLVVATGHFVGEGFDCPALDTLFLAGPVSLKGRLVQYAGRILRAYPGKQTAEVHDYHDLEMPILGAALTKRAPGYISLGFPDPEDPDSGHRPRSRLDKSSRPRDRARQGTDRPEASSRLACPSTCPCARYAADSGRLTEAQEAGLSKTHGAMHPAGYKMPVMRSLLAA